MEGWEQPKRQIPAFNIMTILTRHQINVSKQTMLLDGVGVGLPKQSVCWRGLNRSVHEAMKNISNVKGHLKPRSGNVNIWERPDSNWFTNEIVCLSPSP